MRKVVTVFDMERSQIALGKRKEIVGEWAYWYVLKNIIIMIVAVIGSIIWILMVPKIIKNIVLLFLFYNLKPRWA